MKANDKATIDRIIERAFLHAMKEGTHEQNQEAARNLAAALIEAEVPDKSPLLLIANGFILGMNEGLRLAEELEG